MLRYVFKVERGYYTVSLGQSAFRPPSRPSPEHSPVYPVVTSRPTPSSFSSAKRNKVWVGENELGGGYPASPNEHGGDGSARGEVNVDVNVRAKNGRYWISARLATGLLRTDGTEPATSDSMGGGLCSHSWTKAGDFPPGEDEREKAREDDGWIWPFNANNMNDTRGTVGKGRRRHPS